jgi:aminoglycoside 3-N-acetyltransferase I
MPQNLNLKKRTHHFTITMEVKRLNKYEIADFRNLVKIFQNVFENEENISDNEHLGKLLTNPYFMVFVVKQKYKVVGGLTIYILDRYYGTKPVAYIYDVAISPEFQGKGFGKALIAEVCKYCEDNGFEDAYVAAESDDMDAVNFYKKTKISSEMNTVQFTYTFGN